jgi:hypothetical protein
MLDLLFFGIVELTFLCGNKASTIIIRKSRLLNRAKYANTQARQISEDLFKTSCEDVEF